MSVTDTLHGRLGHHGFVQLLCDHSTTHRCHVTSQSCQISYTDVLNIVTPQNCHIFIIVVLILYYVRHLKVLQNDARHSLIKCLQNIWNLLDSVPDHIVRLS